MAYKNDNEYTENHSNEFLRWEDHHKNSLGELIKLERVYYDKWNPGVNDDIVYTQLYVQSDLSGVPIPAENVTAKIVRIFPDFTRTTIPSV